MEVFIGYDAENAFRFFARSDSGPGVFLNKETGTFTSETKYDINSFYFPTITSIMKILENMDNININLNEVRYLKLCKEDIDWFEKPDSEFILNGAL